MLVEVHLVFLLVVLEAVVLQQLVVMQDQIVVEMVEMVLNILLKMELPCTMAVEEVEVIAVTLWHSVASTTFTPAVELVAGPHCTPPAFHFLASS